MVTKTPYAPFFGDLSTQYLFGFGSLSGVLIFFYPFLGSYPFLWSPDILHPGGWQRSNKIGIRCSVSAFNFKYWQRSLKMSLLFLCHALLRPCQVIFPSFFTVFIFYLLVPCFHYKFRARFAIVLQLLCSWNKMRMKILFLKLKNIFGIIFKNYLEREIIIIITIIIWW